MIIFLYAYLIFLVFFILISIAILYHILKYSYVGDFSIPIMAIYTILALIILVITVYYISVLDWSSPLPAFLA